MKRLSRILGLLAVVVTNVMVAVVAYNFGVLRTDVTCSAPAGTAFLYGIPFLVLIAVCVVLAVFFDRKSR